jgi:lysophospholipid acyltransferase (LPLAT)-like uncharacterized protein
MKRTDRIKLFFITHIGRYLLYLINKTLRYRVVGYENYERAIKQNGNVIFAFWHNGIFMATYYWRKRGIAVLTSQNFDGEYTARIIKRFGYTAIRGSSSRDGVKGLLEMKKHLEMGESVAFTVDGPKGPVYKVQPGAVWLAAKTGKPILPFVVIAKNKIELSSWDHFQIPYPFSTVWMVIGKPLYLNEENDKQKIEDARILLEEQLLGLLKFANFCCKKSLKRSVNSEDIC